MSTQYNASKEGQAMNLLQDELEELAKEKERLEEERIQNAEGKLKQMQDNSQSELEALREMKDSI